MVKNMALKIGIHVVMSHNEARKKLCFVCESKACNTQRLPVEPDNSNFPPSRLETSRAEAFAKPQSVTAMTRKDLRIHWQREGKRSS